MNTFGSLSLPNRPNVAYLHSALVQIGEALRREETDGTPFTPFGPMDAFLMTDPEAEMVKSLRVASSGVGILRLDQGRAPCLKDLPKLTASATRRFARPPKSEPITLQVSTTAIELTSSTPSKSKFVGYADIGYVRLDRTGRIFVVFTGARTTPMCFKATPWIKPALALLIAIAIRYSSLEELQETIFQVAGVVR
jgi:hypothetical protein